MKKQAISLIILSALLMCGSSQAKTDNNAASDALFTNIAAVDEAGCDGAPNGLPCDEQIQDKKGEHDLFSTVSIEDRVWLDEIEECVWYEDDYDDELYTLVDEESTLLDEESDVLSNEVVENIINLDDKHELQAKQAMAAIAVKPIPREVEKPKPRQEQSKPKNRVAKIKPKQSKNSNNKVAQKKSSNAKKKPPTVAKKSNASDKSRSVQRAITYTVRGKSYTTVPDSTGFVQKGVASWYGKRFHGLATASGEPYDMNAMTAAHKKLPLGTKIEVINNENGKKVVVTVNDRGPFHGNRVLDLSKAAAQKLGVVDQGIVDVTIRAL